MGYMSANGIIYSENTTKSGGLGTMQDPSKAPQGRELGTTVVRKPSQLQVGRPGATLAPGLIVLKAILAPTQGSWSPQEPQKSQDSSHDPHDTCKTHHPGVKMAPRTPQIAAKMAQMLS